MVLSLFHCTRLKGLSSLWYWLVISIHAYLSNLNFLIRQFYLLNCLKLKKRFVNRMPFRTSTQSCGLQSVHFVYFL
ncbi:hypothetical protein BD560DRAFT_398893 [Blakeslea trispora]|nr:hypothetical protein BD560DRAFT_398893 [Blakeslea trispora]